MWSTFCGYYGLEIEVNALQSSVLLQWSFQMDNHTHYNRQKENKEEDKKRPNLDVFSFGEIALLHIECKYIAKVK